VREVRPGVWHWETPHPEWQPGERWGPSVSSYAIDEGDGLVLFDPLALPGEIEALAADRETAIVLTCPWHRRDAIGLGERLGAPIYVPPLDPPDPHPVPGTVFRAGEAKGATSSSGSARASASSRRSGESRCPRRRTELLWRSYRPAVDEMDGPWGGYARLMSIVLFHLVYALVDERLSPTSSARRCARRVRQT